MERQLMQSEKLASLGFLVSGVAHEINNPNNFITFNLPILRDYLQEIIPIIDNYADERQDFELFGMSYPEFRKDIFKLLDNIEHGSKRINTTVSSLREFSRNKDKVEKDLVDIRQVIEKGLAISRGKIRRMVKSFEVNIPKGLPRIYTDPQILEHILINLLINAAQAADKEDSWVRIGVSLGNTWWDRLNIEVSDNGCGMDKETIGKVFDPFFTTKPSGEGTGVGLSVCHTLVESLGGRIEVESESGKGSTFKVILTEKNRRRVKR
jgi:signal transduction histidine kinase